MNNKLLFGLVVLAVGALVGWYVFGGSAPSVEQLTGKKPQDATNAGVTNTPMYEAGVPSGTQMTDKGGVATRTVVTYTDTGFSPLVVTVKTGGVVTFVNESSRSMWVASDVHPTHQLLPGFDQKTSVARGQTYEYTFTNVGTWRYHNHQNPSDAATVVVN